MVPLTLPCPARLAIAASFDYTGFNGRALADGVMDVMLSLRPTGRSATALLPTRPASMPIFPYFDLGNRKPAAVLGVIPGLVRPDFLIEIEVVAAVPAGKANRDQ